MLQTARPKLGHIFLSCKFIIHKVCRICPTKDSCFMIQLIYLTNFSLLLLTSLRRTLPAPRRTKSQFETSSENQISQRLTEFVAQLCFDWAMGLLRVIQKQAHYAFVVKLRKMIFFFSQTVSFRLHSPRGLC